MLPVLQHVVQAGDSEAGLAGAVARGAQPAQTWQGWRWTELHSTAWPQSSIHVWLQLVVRPGSTCLLPSHLMPSQLSQTSAQCMPLSTRLGPQPQRGHLQHGVLMLPLPNTMPGMQLCAAACRSGHPGAVTPCPAMRGRQVLTLAWNDSGPHLLGLGLFSSCQ